MQKNIDWCSIVVILLSIAYLAAIISGGSLIMRSDWTVWQKVGMMILMII